MKPAAVAYAVAQNIPACAGIDPRPRGWFTRTGTPPHTRGLELQPEDRPAQPE